MAFSILMISVIVLGPALARGLEVDNETCLACHDDYAEQFSSTRHILSLDSEKSPITIGCASCHTGAEIHIEDPEIGNIMNPAKALPSESEAVCTECHNPHVESGMPGFDPHRMQNFSCSSCHRVHSDNKSLLIDEEGEFCGTCHTSIVSQFRRRSNHPLTDQAVTCMSCHDFSGRDHAMIGHGESSNCADCHPEQAGPFMFDHRATISFSTEGDGCTACHRPHGSPNDRLLTQTGDRLCRQCHGLPPLHRTKHNGLGSQFECTECHSDIHGSYINRDFLDAQLGTRIGGAPGSCFCHNIED
jgi:DmsE family decaheme c-type cytochrome